MCGLFGFSGHKKADLTKIKLLATYNVDRGKMSTGVFINNEVIKDLGDAFKFLSNNKLEYNQTKERVIFGHTRQASSGAATKANAHPFEFIKKKNNKNDIAEYHSAFAHNGTLYDWRIDMKKWLTTSKYDVDSNALGMILSGLDYDYLSSYKGAVTYMRTDHRFPNTLEIFKGASLNYKNELEADRPMFALQTKEGIYFSSMKNSLEAIQKEGDEFIDIPDNKVLRFKNGILDEENSFEISREVKKQTGATTTTTTTTSGTTRGTTKSQYSKQTNNYSSTNSKIGYHNSSRELSQTEKKILASEKKEKTGGLFWSNSIHFNINVFRGTVYYNRGRYYRNGHLLNSFYHADDGRLLVAPSYLDKDGKNKSDYTKKELEKAASNTFSTYYFYKGIMLAVKSNEAAKDVYNRISRIFKVVARSGGKNYNLATASCVISRYATSYFAFLDEELPEPTRRFGIYYNGENILFNHDINNNQVVTTVNFMRKVTVVINNNNGHVVIMDPNQSDYTAKALNDIVNTPVVENKDYADYELTELMDNFGPNKALIYHFFMKLTGLILLLDYFEEDEDNMSDKNNKSSALLDDLEQLSGDISLFIERLDEDFYGNVMIGVVPLEECDLDMTLANVKESIDTIVGLLKQKENIEA